MPLGASVDPARKNGPGHRPLLDAEDRVCQEHGSRDVALRRMLYRNPGGAQQPVEIFIGLVVRLVPAAATDEVSDIAKILADHNELWVAVAEPLLPMADHIRIEIEFGATADPAGTSLDTEAARFARRNEVFKFPHPRPMPGPARRDGEAGGPRGQAARGAAVCFRNT